MVSGVHLKRAEILGFGQLYGAGKGLCGSDANKFQHMCQEMLTGTDISQNLPCAAVKSLPANPIFMGLWLDLGAMHEQMALEP